MLVLVLLQEERLTLRNQRLAEGVEMRWQGARVALVRPPAADRQKTRKNEARSSTAPLQRQVAGLKEGFRRPKERSGCPSVGVHDLSCPRKKKQKSKRTPTLRS